MNKAFGVAAGCVLAFAACSGAGSGGNPGPVASRGQSAQKVLVTVAFSASGTAKQAARTRSYVSPSTLGAVITATSTDNSANDSEAGYTISGSNPACLSNPNGGSLDCSLTIPLAVDTYSIRLATYDANDSGLPANLGTELAVDTENESVVDSPTANVFTFNPHAFVAGFSFSNDAPGAAIARAPAVRHPLALAPTLPGFVFGAVGGTTSSISADGRALDRDGNAIDSYPGNTTFANGTFTVSVAEPGDRTGCSAADPCMGVSNALGTSYGPSGGPATPPATIPLATPSDENLTLAYSGGGSYGAGVVAWPTPRPSASASAAPPSGTGPYYADISIPTPAGVAATPYVVPHEYVAPLFAYASVGANKPFVAPASAETIYVWAAQALPPINKNEYSANFGGIPQCNDADDDVVAAIAGGTYYAGYGEVFTIVTSPGQGIATTNCTLTLNDGVGDSQTVSIPVAGVLIPASGIRNSTVAK